MPLSQIGFNSFQPTEGFATFLSSEKDGRSVVPECEVIRRNAPAIMLRADKT